MMSDVWSNLKDRLFFSVEDVSELKGITITSAYVLCSRYVRRGIFIRVKKNFYVLERNWTHYGTRDFFKISNHLRTPSYISCMTALSYYGVTTQVQRNWYENITQRHTVKIEAGGALFSYTKIAPQYYTGFFRQDDVFIATPEKALLDAVYLNSLGRYPLDWASLDPERLDIQNLTALLTVFPENVRRRVKEKCRI